MARFLRWTVLLLVCALPVQASAQGYFDQNELEDLLSVRAENLDALPEVFYEYHRFDDPRENTVLARNTFYKRIGDGDISLGKQRSQLVELLNRDKMESLELGDTLVVPTRWDLDFRAYSPFPRYYTGARNIDKVFIIHKEIQAFAAYEYGQLARWGVVNTGDPKATETPNGRYNFNWKEEYRVSSLSPPDEDWEMYWVFNFYNARGIHIHQYAFPTGGPTSHGCVRLIDADAKWIYSWADAWKTTVGTTGIGSSQGRLIEPGTMVLVLGDEPAENPNPFSYKKRYPVLKRINLPSNPYAVPPGTPQQERFDKLRARNAAPSR